MITSGVVKWVCVYPPAALALVQHFLGHFAEFVHATLAPNATCTDGERELRVQLVRDIYNVQLCTHSWGHLETAGQIGKIVRAVMTRNIMDKNVLDEVLLELREYAQEYAHAPPA